jgi:hypothetical protein
MASFNDRSQTSCMSTVRTRTVVLDTYSVYVDYVVCGKGLVCVPRTVDYVRTAMICSPSLSLEGKEHDPRDTVNKRPSTYQTSFRCISLASSKNQRFISDMVGMWGLWMWWQFRIFERTSDPEQQKYNRWVSGVGETLLSQNLIEHRIKAATSNPEKLAFGPFWDREIARIE